ncbi:hypothetical protein HS096_02570 [candidate division WWE3 bacterium]|uniref:GP-PDE domain-containing protein n=1 Tax=candidate division WWE3 bacterium TaxID=2053526 RepID=A0A928Y4V9_UNCKA|nr:hypothetical protein [candidate division WWE3 bacterium]
MTESSFRAMLWAMLIFAHRGVASKGVDENSIEAIRRAVELGVDGIELDIHRSRDGLAVVTHDKDLRRIAGDNRRISELTRRDFRKIRLRKGMGIPTLDEVTASVPAPVRLDFEIKDRAALELLVRKLRTSTGLRSRSFISSFQKDVLLEAAAMVPDVQRILLMKRWPRRTEFAMEWFLQHGIYGVGLPSTFWNTERVRALKERGVCAVAWENWPMRSTERRARHLREIGIDIAIVNQPDTYRSTG